MAPDNQSSDQELVELARHDPDAFAVLYRRYLPRIRAFAIRRCANTHLADDITAAVFERAWRNLADLDVPEHGIAPWLYRIASNELASHFRKSGRGQRAQERLERGPQARTTDPADDVVLQTELSAVREALGRLNPRHQEVISLRYLAGLTPQETAEAMGIPPPVVAAVLHRALKALEAAIGHDLDDIDNQGRRKHRKGR